MQFLNKYNGIWKKTPLKFILLAYLIDLVYYSEMSVEAEPVRVFYLTVEQQMLAVCSL